MKNQFIKGLFLFVSISLCVNARTIKVCDTDVILGEETKHYVMRVDRNDGSLSGEIDVDG